MTTKALVVKNHKPSIVLERWDDTANAAQTWLPPKHKNSWIVDAPRTTALWYSVLLNNLVGNYWLPYNSSIDTIRTALNSGLRRDAFDRLRSIVDIPSEQLGKTIGVPQRTLSRRDRFKPDESERLVRVASVFQKALGVLGGIDQARRWFVSPKRALGEKTPLEFCDTDPGAEEVEHLLGRIEHGIFS